MKEFKPKFNDDGTVTIQCSYCGNDLILPKKVLDVTCSNCGNSLRWKVRIKDLKGRY